MYIDSQVVGMTFKSFSLFWKTLMSLSERKNEIEAFDNFFRLLETRHIECKLCQIYDYG